MPFTLKTMQKWGRSIFNIPQNINGYDSVLIYIMEYKGSSTKKKKKQNHEEGNFCSILHSWLKSEGIFCHQTYTNFF